MFKALRSSTKRLGIRLKIFKLRLRIFYYRIYALKKSLKILLILALAFLISTQFLKVHVRHSFTIDFFSRLCYAYLTSLIFYFIVVHAPKEEKKQALVIIIRNRTFHIHHVIRDYYRFILKANGISIVGGSKDELISSGEFTELCKKFQLRDGLYIGLLFSNHQFENHFQCYRYMGQHVKDNIGHIIHYYDFLSPGHLQKLNQIQEAFSSPPFDGTVLGNKSLSEIAPGFYLIMQDANSIFEEMDKFKKKDAQEHRAILKIRNLKKQLTSIK